MNTSQREESAEPRDSQEQLAPESGSFGTWLRQQREVREITLREIADESKISLRYLQALEEDRFDLLPASVFAKGFLRQYAGYVGLDAEDVVNFYIQARQASQPEDDELETAERQPRAASWSWGVALALVIALLVAIVALLSYLAEAQREPPAPAGATVSTDLPEERTAEAPPPQSPRPEGPPPELPPPANVGPPAAVEAGPAADTAPEAPPAPLTVTLDFTGECWVEATLDRRRRISELRVQGESLQLAAQEQVRLTLGDAGAVLVEVNGEPYDLGRGPGQVVRDLVIDLGSIGVRGE